MNANIRLTRFVLLLVFVTGTFLPAVAWISRKNATRVTALPLPFRDCTVVTEGYPEYFSCFQGERLKFFVNCKEEAMVRLALADISERVVDSVLFSGFIQDTPGPDAYVTGFGYRKSFTYHVPYSMKSGMYHWLGTDIWFLVKEKKHKAPIVIVYPSNTEQAYNYAGGKSLYDFNSTNKKRASVVSFQRPVKYQVTPAYNILDFTRGFLSWLTETEYDYRLISDRDLDNSQSIQGAQIVAVIGHSEYWSVNARKNLDAFNDSGGSVVVFAGNTMYWQVRYASGFNALVCYKDSAADPVKDNHLRTISWTAPSVDYPVLRSIGADFLHGGYGTKPDHGWDGYKITTPESPLLDGTHLHHGDILHLRTHEFDGTLLKPQSEPGEDPYPDLAAMDAYRLEIIGYDLGHCQVAGCRSVATFIVYQRTETSGPIVNTASTNWCSPESFYGKDAEYFRTITSNTFDLLLGRKSVFRLPEINAQNTGEE